jgi:creatinine amidohydrolase
MRYVDHTYPEIARLAGEDAVLVLPMGCTEQQGPHLPVDFDTWFAEALCVSAADRALEMHGVRCLVLQSRLRCVSSGSVVAFAGLVLVSSAPS